MKTWDIVDRIYPGLHITEALSNPSRIAGGVSSKMKVALVVSLFVASSGEFKLPDMEHAAIATARVSITRTESGGQNVRGKAPSPRGMPTDADTQFGQSTPKLAKLFPVYLEPVADEDKYEEDYSFS